jgi:diguanylate cyclase (GGDEF)-like protein
MLLGHILMPNPNFQSDRFSGSGITTRFVSLVLLASLITALVVGGASLYSVYAPLRQRNEDLFSAVLGRSGEQVRSLFETAQADLMSIAREPRLRAATLAAAAQVAGGEAPDTRLPAFLAEILSQTPEFAGLLVLDLSGTVLANAGSGAALEGLLEALEHKDALGGAELVEIMETKQLQKDLGGVDGSLIRALAAGAAPRVVIVASPLSGRDGVPVASVVGLVRQQGLASRLGAGLLGESGNVLLVDEQGQLVSAGHGTTAALAAPLAGGLPGEADDCKLRIDWSAAWDGAVTCTLSLGRLGWVLVARQPLHDSFRPLFIMAPAALMGAVIVALGLSLLASWVAAATIVRPLYELHQGIVAVARGDFSTNVSDRRAPGEVKSLVRAFNRLVLRLKDRSQDSESSQLALEVQNKTFQQKYQTVSQLSVTDPLTQLHNRRFFEEYLEREISRLGRNGDGLYLLVIDIDDFKALNDNYGHAAGDEFLTQIARVMKESVRETDLLARFGGEEFVVVLNGSDISGATVLAEKLRTNVAEASFIVDDTMRPRRATVSIGLATYKGSQTDLFNSADAALYRAKDSGKNCVVTTDA